MYIVCCKRLRIKLQTEQTKNIWSMITHMRRANKTQTLGKRNKQKEHSYCLLYERILRKSLCLSHSNCNKANVLWKAKISSYSNVDHHICSKFCSFTFSFTKFTYLNNIISLVTTASLQKRFIFIVNFIKQINKQTQKISFTYLHVDIRSLDLHWL